MTNNPDSEFLDAGREEGLQIWRINNFKVTPVNKSEYGYFYTGDSYLVLHTKKFTETSFEWNIHYWMGATTSIDESCAVAIKAVELDDYLGGRPIQHREVQNHESKLFLSYFEKKGIRYLQGGYDSGLKVTADIVSEKKLYMVKGRRDVRIIQVPLASSSLNKSDVFILDDGKNIFQWNPPQSNPMERIKAAFYANQIRDQEHGGRANMVNIVDDWETNEEFWNSIAGSPDEVQEFSDMPDVGFENSFNSSIVSLYKVTDEGTDKVTISHICDGPLSKSMLNSDDCFIVDCRANGIYSWIGKKCTKKEKISSIMGAKELMTSKKYVNYLPLTQVIDGGENTSFKSIFSDWTD